MFHDSKIGNILIETLQDYERFISLHKKSASFNNEADEYF